MCPYSKKKRKKKKETVYASIIVDYNTNRISCTYLILSLINEVLINQVIKFGLWINIYYIWTANKHC